MADQKQGGGDGDAAAQELGVVLVAFAVMCVFLWFAYGKFFSSAMSTIRRYEMAVFAPYSPEAAKLHTKLVIQNGGSLNFKQTAAMLTKTGAYVRWLYVPPVLILAFFLYKRSFRRRYSVRHTMESLALSQAKLWPEIAPVAGRQVEFTSGDIRKGRWAAVATEWEFALRHKLAKRGGELDKDAARAVFIKQLGKRWTGPDDLARHQKGIFAAFIMRIAGDIEGSMAAIRTMSASFDENKPESLDISFADVAIQEHIKHPKVQRILRTHAYVYPVLGMAEQVSRGNGVVASALFTWVRAVDRRLWYMLSSVGRRLPFVEAAAIFSHWQFEKAVGQMIATPMIEGAVTGLAKALKEYTEDDAEERLFA